jgi:ArsR family transcriptional regulator
MKTVYRSNPTPDAMFRAFSDRTRLRILNLLGGGELCVCDIMTTLAIPQAKASRHLAYLRRTGLVNVRKEGLWSHYSLAPAKNTFHASLLECLTNCFNEMPKFSQDRKRLKKTRCC